jgi:hypothetical protein
MPWPGDEPIEAALMLPVGMLLLAVERFISPSGIIEPADDVEPLGMPVPGICWVIAPMGIAVTEADGISPLVMPCDAG